MNGYKLFESQVTSGTVGWAISPQNYNWPIEARGHSVHNVPNEYDKEEIARNFAWKTVPALNFKTAMSFNFTLISWENNISCVYDHFFNYSILT